MRDKYQVEVIKKDIYKKEEEIIMERSKELQEESIIGVEKGG